MAEQAVPVEDEPYAGGMDATAQKRRKITVWVDPERLDRARKAVQRGKSSSISDWVNEALRKHDSSFGWCTTWQEAFEDWLREVGPLPEEELEWAREIFKDWP
jgi:Arc/MetJ-type ribon-helix-helix transcriptional regulator